MVKKTRSASTVVKRGTRASAAAHAHEDNDVDGCDVEFRESDATPDDELPPARGGVEVVRAKRGRSARR